MPSEEYWAKSGFDTIQPPLIKRPPDKPKKQRRRAPEEIIENPYRIKRKYKETECSKRGNIGHNARTCKNAPLESSKKKKNNNKAFSQATNDIGVTNEQIAVILGNDLSRRILSIVARHKHLKLDLILSNICLCFCFPIICIFHHMTLFIMISTYRDLGLGHIG